MDELATYRKILLRKKLSRLNDYFNRNNENVADKNFLIRYGWKIITFFIKSFFGICLYVEYLSWKFNDFAFDAHYMDFQIQARGFTADEAIKFLTEQEIKLKEYIYRNVIAKEKQSKAEKSLDYLFTKYRAQKEEETGIPHISRRQPEWITRVWENLLAYKCVLSEYKSDFVLIMMGATPVNKLIWSKGLIKLVQFVEEGIEIGKIYRQGFDGKDQFIMEYITSNFRPNPNIPNQKLEHYTSERIKTAQNEFLKIKPKDRIKEFFVFD